MYFGFANGLVPRCNGGFTRAHQSEHAYLGYVPYLPRNMAHAYPLEEANRPPKGSVGLKGFSSKGALRAVGLATTCQADFFCRWINRVSILIHLAHKHGNAINA